MGFKIVSVLILHLLVFFFNKKNLLVFGADEKFLDAPRDCLRPPHHFLLDRHNRHHDGDDDDLFIGRSLTAIIMILFSPTL